MLFDYVAMTDNFSWLYLPVGTLNDVQSGINARHIIPHIWAAIFVR